MYVFYMSLSLAYRYFAYAFWIHIYDKTLILLSCPVFSFGTNAVLALKIEKYFLFLFPENICKKGSVLFLQHLGEIMFKTIQSWCFLLCVEIYTYDLSFCTDRGQVRIFICSWISVLIYTFLKNVFITLIF